MYMYSLSDSELITRRAAEVGRYLGVEELGCEARHVFEVRVVLRLRVEERQEVHLRREIDPPHLGGRGRFLISEVPLEVSPNRASLIRCTCPGYEPQLSLRLFPQASHWLNCPGRLVSFSCRGKGASINCFLVRDVRSG